MTDDLYPPTALPAALHTMADSEQPPVMDVEHVLHQGRRSLLRRRMAALGGGTAVLAVSALLVGTLAGAGSGVQGGPDSAAAATFTVDPHDPVTTHWQFAYVPPGMIALGGYDSTEVQVSTVLVSESDRFALDLLPMRAPLAVGEAKGESAPTQKVPVKVPGATTAYWLGYGSDRIAIGNSRGSEMAELTLQLKSGQWLEILVNHLEERKDWKGQTLKAAASLVQKDRSVPMPFRVAEVPENFKPLAGGNAMHTDGLTNADIGFRLGPDQTPSVGIFAFTTGTEKTPSQHGTEYTCKDSNGLTICVSVSDPEPAALKAVGGAQGLLDRVTSLGNDPANWTTDVFH